MLFWLRAGRTHTSGVGHLKLQVARHPGSYRCLGSLTASPPLPPPPTHPPPSVEEVLHNIDTAIQFGEDAEVKVRDHEGGQGGEGEEGGSEDDQG